MNDAIRLILSTMLGFLVLLGCQRIGINRQHDWPMLGGGPKHQGRASAPEPQPPLGILWETKLGDAISGSPATRKKNVYVTSYDKHIYCVGTDDGNIVWSYQTDDWMESTPVIDHDRVFSGSYDGFFYAWQADTGDLLWRVKTGERRAGVNGWGKVKRGIDSSACVVKGIVYFGAWDGYVYALDVRDGSSKWKYDAGNLIHWSSPAVGGGRLFIGVANGELHALDAATGGPLWKRVLCKPHVEHMMCGPTITGRLVLTGAGWSGGLFALDVKSGETVWESKVNGLVVGSPAVCGSKIYCYTANRKGAGQVHALHRRTGKQIWVSPIGGSSACSPAIVDGVVYVTTGGAPDGNSLFALDAETGSVIWQMKTAGVWGSPAIGSGKMFVGLGDGSLIALGVSGR